MWMNRWDRNNRMNLLGRYSSINNESDWEKGLETAIYSVVGELERLYRYDFSSEFIERCEKFISRVKQDPTLRYKSRLVLATVLIRVCAEDKVSFHDVTSITCCSPVTYKQVESEVARLAKTI